MLAKSILNGIPVFFMQLKKLPQRFIRRLIIWSGTISRGNGDHS